MMAEAEAKPDTDVDVAELELLEDVAQEVEMAATQLKGASYRGIFPTLLTCGIALFRAR